MHACHCGMFFSSFYQEEELKDWQTALLFALLLSCFCIFPVFNILYLGLHFGSFAQPCQLTGLICSQSSCRFPFFTCRLYRRGSLECEWRGVLGSTILLNFAMYRLFEDTRTARKCIFCFMIRSEQRWRSRSHPGDKSFNPWTFYGPCAVLCVETGFGFKKEKYFLMHLQSKRSKVKPVFNSWQIVKCLIHIWQGGKSPSQIN